MSESVIPEFPAFEQSSRSTSQVLLFSLLIYAKGGAQQRNALTSLAPEVADASNKALMATMILFFRRGETIRGCAALSRVLHTFAFLSKGFGAETLARRSSPLPRYRTVPMGASSYSQGKKGRAGHAGACHGLVLNAPRVSLFSLVRLRLVLLGSGGGSAGETLQKFFLSIPSQTALLPSLFQQIKQDK